ncbi:hypothetical protein [Pelagicoccus sp. SDUM812002]|uniref:hypothetical protein n=1 Tax=Pelagicoccus sp. SDUM812002 TaxID=3041266 RepID=UPI00280EB73C|nr:hypothetical protein [Pelagicoccus sp. SDUM812002]MDQ8186369.1 hypothetical protein [Pelagicoccus sp. SDUM812002]
MDRNKYHGLIEKLPHRGAMRLIDSISALDSRTVETETRVDETRTALFGRDGKVETYLGIELVAQSAAFPLIYDDSGDEEHMGMIVQVRSFESFCSPETAMPVLRTTCEVDLLLDGKVASVRGKVFEGETCLCEAVLTLAVGGSK